MLKSMGQAAYDKWVELLPAPDLTVSWEHLPEPARQAWEQIAVAAVEQYALNLIAFKER
jgi:hypothetical protein